VLFLFVVASLEVGAAVVARHRAQTAADLASLAAARRLLAGSATPCAAAARVAAAMGAQIRACHAHRQVVDVVAEVPLTGLLAGLPPARARARAGGGP
jgi:secretion/DNA translocation related TadE-like protein